MNVIKVYYDYVELKPQRKHFSNILFLESDSDFSDEEGQAPYLIP